MHVQVGRTVAAARERFGDDLLIVFTADHGESLGEHDFYYDHGDYVYNARTGVPLGFVLPPKHRYAGFGRCPGWVSLVDVAPTILSLLGVSIMLSQVYALHSIDEDIEGLFDAVLHGKLLHSSMWVITMRDYPSLPRPAWIVDLPAMAATSLLVGLAAWMLRIRRRRSWLSVALACLLIIPTAYTVTRLSMINNTDISTAGPRLAFAILVTLYALGACSLFAWLEIVTAARRGNRSEPLPV